MIKIIDCGSQLTQNIARRIRELDVFTEIVPFHTKPEDIKTEDLEGIIISGGQFSVYDKESPLYSKEVLNLGAPVLGICYGQQSIAYLLGGKVTPTENREYGETNILLSRESPLFKDIPCSEFKVWMSHGDIVQKVPEGFEILARTSNGHIASIKKDNIYAVQFHPEVDHTEHGREILNNFLNICDAERTWNPERDYERLAEETEEKIKGKVGVGGISGGVDSSTASVLIDNIVGGDYHPIFVNNGLLRLNEAEEVRKNFSSFNLNINYVDASERFLTKLKGVTDPDRKRKIIGHEFIRVFEEEARKIEDATYLVQGTLYPDVIESVPIYGSSSKIKRHHNVGGLPENMGLELVEPFRNMFKDEVRKIAENRLGLPKEIVYRHPFPGPGLAIRIIGEVTSEKLDLVRKADYILTDELKERDLYYKISQAFAVLINAQSVGVMGDEGTYQGIIGLRVVTTDDFMTSDWYDFKKADLTAIGNRVTNEVKGVNRVVYDITQKPPATIEWE
ncbi:MAG: glutamine-hydrolyzing GMP synthase [Candidatus Woesearchaeota archaeon]|jgi:GMP synthase (glutamine-hydrolysing)|nr:glutamine-hydrolyzing GMP synthase [Candidatus Woesearchaeota archaeon]MDP7610373.1 glutamine-hydrolyzing GMP synthase [Candidatus Woesearchaeota archaeon]